MAGRLEVELALLHDDFESAEVFFLEVDGWLGHQFVNLLRNEVDVASRVDHYAVDETLVFGGREKFFDILYFDMDCLALLVGHLLLYSSEGR